MRYILAHDLGTSGNKATLYSEEGTMLASATVAYPTRCFNGTWAEQEPEAWWQAVCGSTRALLAEAPVAPAEIAVVALSGQMMGCTPVDKDGRALRPSLLYCDQRATREADALLERIPMRDFYSICGHRASAAYALEKLMWLRDNEPDIFRRTHLTLCAKDYVNYRLTGIFATDFSDASGTNAFDLNRFAWSEKVLALAGIGGELFPRAVDSATVIGEITGEAARATGLAAGTPVAAGGGDGSAAGVGAGCVRPGSAYICLGSSAWVGLTVGKPIHDPGMRTMNWAHCVPGYLHPTGTMQTAGASFKWLAEQLCAAEAETAKARGDSVYARIDEAAAAVPPGANGLLFLPYLLGERTPWWNPDARGAFIGISLASTRADMMRAVMEGVAMSLGLIADIFRAHVPVEALTVIGGGARSAVWRQILADACGCPVRTLTSRAEATSMGAAVIGGVACGLFKDFGTVDRFVVADRTVPPRAGRVALYRESRALMERAYRGLADVYADLAESCRRTL
jgi:xylulokinase